MGNALKIYYKELAYIIIKDNKNEQKKRRRMVEYLKRQNAPTLAYHHASGDRDKPTIVFLGGFRSDMGGTKAVYLEEQCITEGLSYVRFDYRGHGQSEGVFEESCIGEWLQDTLDIMGHCTSDAEKVVVVGSSMGGWLSLLMALQRPQNVHAIIGLAAAPDFTTWMEQAMTEAQHREMMEQGFIALPNDYSDEPYIITRKLIEDGREHCLLNGTIHLDMPVRLIQGKKDTDVPWEVAAQIKDALTAKDVQVIYIEEADHRLSKPDELAVLRRTLFELLDQ